MSSLLLLNFKNMKHACPRPVSMLFPPPAPLGTVPREAICSPLPALCRGAGSCEDLVEPALQGSGWISAWIPGLLGHPPGTWWCWLYACCCSPVPRLAAPLAQLISSAPGAWHLFLDAFSLLVGSCWNLKRLYLLSAPSLEAGPAGSWTPGCGCAWGQVRADGRGSTSRMSGLSNLRAQSQPHMALLDCCSG